MSFLILISEFLLQERMSRSILKFVIVNFMQFQLFDPVYNVVGTNDHKQPV